MWITGLYTVNGRNEQVALTCTLVIVTYDDIDVAIENVVIITGRTIDIYIMIISVVMTVFLALSSIIVSNWCC